MSVITGDDDDNNLAGDSLEDDEVFGGLGNDTLSGGEVNFGFEDRLFGEDGNDVLIGSPGDTSLSGGTGGDRFVLNGPPQSDIITIMDFTAADGDKVDLSQIGISDFATVRSLIDLNDGFFTYRFDSSATGVIFVGISPDQLTASDFILDSTKRSDNVHGTTTSDDLFGGLGNDKVHGGDPWDDSLTKNDDRLFGEGGNDVLTGGHDSDTLIGGAGADRFVVDDAIYFERTFSSGTTKVSQSQTDVIADFGQGEHDRIDVSGLGIAEYATVRLLLGDSGTDTVLQFRKSFNLQETVIRNINSKDLTAADFIFDTKVENEIVVAVAGSNGTATDLFGGFGNDTIFGGPDSVGGASGDRLFGESGNDVLDAGGGEDGLFADSKDTLDGGSGRDLVTFGAADAAIEVNLATGISSGDGAAAGDVLLRIESVVGSSFDDRLIGNILANNIAGGGGGDTINGGAGNDTLNGGRDADVLFGMGANDYLIGLAGGDAIAAAAGNDRLRGGAGNDTMAGGAGRDSFIFDLAGFGADRISDFRAGQDKLAFTSVVADKFDDLEISGNGTNDVVVRVDGSAASVAIHSALKLTIGAEDVIFLA